MNWSDERYVRLFIRDTVTWKSLKFEGQTVLMHVLRKLDRAGVLDIGSTDPVEAVHLVTDIPIDFARIGLKRCIDCGVLEVDGDRILMPNYLDAQESIASNAARVRKYRARQKDLKDLMPDPDPPDPPTPNPPDSNAALPGWRNGNFAWLKVFGCWAEFTDCFDEPGHHKQACESIARMALKMDSQNPRRPLERAVRNCAADPWVLSKRPTPNYLAKNWTKFAAGPKRSKNDDDYRDLSRKAKEIRENYDYAVRMDDSAGVVAKLKTQAEIAKSKCTEYLAGY